MQELKNSIATQLAKKEIRFSKGDENDQDRLKQLLVKTGEISEDVEMFVSKMKAAVVENNSEIAISPELELDILVKIEQGVLSGEISSVAQMNSPDYQKAICNEIESFGMEHHIPRTDNGANNIINTFNLDSTLYDKETFKIVALFVNNDMTKVQKDAANFYKDLATNNSDRLEYYKRNKGTPADRGAYMDILNALTVSMQDAIEVAKKVDQEDLIVNNQINIQDVYKRFVKSYEIRGEQIPEMYSTLDKCLQRVLIANKEKSEKLTSKPEIKEKIETAKTETEKKQIAEIEIERRKKQGKIIRKIAEIKRNEPDALSLNIVMDELMDNHREESKTILLTIASRNSTPQWMKSEIITFANKKYSQKEEIKESIESTPQVPSEPVPTPKDPGSER